jgi:hypothetical protein
MAFDVDDTRRRISMTRPSAPWGDRWALAR